MPNNTFDPSSLAAIDYQRVAPITVLEVDDSAFLTTLTVEHLARRVLNPEAAENPRAVDSDVRFAEYRDIRAQVQRLIEGKKKKNIPIYASYLRDVMLGKIDGVHPPIELYTPIGIETQDGPLGASLALLPHSMFFVAIDGETQTAGWQRVLAELQQHGLAEAKVPVVIHHGKPIDWARQAFHDLNVLGVRPNTAVGISMDSRDFATQVTRRLTAVSELLADRVEQRRRQLRRRDPALVTVSALRQAVVVTMIGSRGLEIGARAMPAFDDEVDTEQLADATVEVWTTLLDELEDAFVHENGERRVDSMVSAPSVMVGIAFLAHRVIEGDMSIDQLLELLSDVVWDRTLDADTNPNVVVYPWLDVGGKLSTRGNFSVGGPKEYAHSIASALENPHSKRGRQIRGIELDAVTVDTSTAS